MATIINSGNKKRKLGFSFNPMLADVASGDDLDLYFNNQTTERADRGIYDPEDKYKGFGGVDRAEPFDDLGNNFNVNQNTVKNQQSVNNMFSSPDEAGERMQANAIASLASQNNGTEYDDFRSTRMEKDAMPERDAARDARTTKIAKIRAIAQGAVLLRDIIASSNGGFAIGSIGGGEDYMQALQSADDDYNQRLNQWSQQNLAAERFNAEADNQDRLLNFRARQDKMDQNFRAGESEKDRALRIELAAKQREIDEAAIKAREKGASADYVRFTTDQQKFDYQQKTDALRYQQLALNDLRSQYNGMMSSQKSTPEGQALKQKIDQESVIEEQMRRQLSAHQIYDIDEPGTVQSTGGAPKGMGARDYIRQYMPEMLDKRFDLGGQLFTAEELYDSGEWTLEDIKKLNQQ